MPEVFVKYCPRCDRAYEGGSELAALIKMEEHVKKHDDYELNED